MNSQYFSKEQVKAGELQKLLDFLMLEAYGKGDHYNDIHIYPADLGAFIIEWDQIPWSGKYGGQFKYINEDQLVVYQKDFPDGHFDYFETEEDYKNALSEWLKKHPNYKQNEFGRWYNEDDYRDLQK